MIRNMVSPMGSSLSGGRKFARNPMAQGVKEGVKSKRLPIMGRIEMAIST
jgi:hypothetical protein